MRIAVYEAPAMLAGVDLGDAQAVAIDVLRMTSVAAQAVQNGCAGLLAVPTVEEARETARASGALLGGERKALPIEGFDLSNSPLEYTPERVGGRLLVMSTSNGTQATQAARGAKRLLLGALVNAGAVARAVAGAESLALVCAGTMGAFTLEDALAAGAMIDRLLAMDVAARMNDMAVAAHRLYVGARDDLAGALAQTAHFGRLMSLGLGADVAFCLTEDSHTAVPERGPDGWFR